MKTVKIIAIAFIAGFAGAFVCFKVFIEKQTTPAEVNYNTLSYDAPHAYQPGVTSTENAVEGVDFSTAASRAIPSVVYINSISQGVSYSYWDLMFGGGGQQTQVSSGSGVIFSADGYIVTNNHVVGGAEKIEVIYNKNVYSAELVGTDPSTDLAVLKINETGLPAVAIGNSSTLQVGEWVVAVGNPFSLSSTVTAGIVSAKGRRIGILEDKFPIESFIQTDAAINPGNSGGALVNKAGELVGINTAILSRTGSYTGYAFAVPVDIAKKVVDDLIKYGIVQKALFGGNVVDYDFQNAKKYKLNVNGKNFNGVLLERLDEVGPASEAGLQQGDIITKINDKNINSVSAFEEELSYRYPGDKVNITYTRNNNTTTIPIILVNKAGTTEKVKRKIFSSDVMGARLEATDYGVKVFKISDGYLKKLGVPENYTIISINRVRVNDPQEVIDFFEKFKGRVNLYGMNSSRQAIPYNFILK
ncbi:MAG: trypsin-like peptidase domain-containing protein [Cyclobacteriaceae bacterium]